MIHLLDYYCLDFSNVSQVAQSETTRPISIRRLEDWPIVAIIRVQILFKGNGFSMAVFNIDGAVDCTRDQLMRFCIIGPKVWKVDLKRNVLTQFNTKVLEDTTSI